MSGASGASGGAGASDGWFRREAAASVPRQRDDEPDADRLDDGHRNDDVLSDGTSGSTVEAPFDSDSDVGQDSWQESEHPEHTHDPHEVTVQLDGVGRQLEDWLVQQAKGPSTQESSDGPVFVDETGRRSRRYRRIGMAVGMACAVYAMVILATLLSGNSAAPWLPELGKQDDSPAGKVDSPPLVAESAEPSGAVTPSPGTTPSADDLTTRSPGAGTSADPSASASASGKSTAPKPSTSNTKPNPDPEPTRSTPSNPVTTSPDPEPTDTGVSEGPSDPPAAGDTDTVAGEPLTPEPVPVTPDPTTAPSSSSSPENVL
ncbi:hypothetical protein ACFWBR_29185 [Streptomyces sp. NPDC060006]|uniref:hypothetical protein n=1 Tax=unclassified Streptomyces TaxID=2593676 RepID=UPI00368F2A02